MKYFAIVIVALLFYLAYDKAKPPAQAPVQMARPGELSDVEKDYYVKLFDYAMDALPANQDYPWKSSDANGGVIAAGESFTSKSGAICRRFHESFLLAGHAGKYGGIACKREGAEGWCRLKEKDALTCALERPGSYANYYFPGGGNYSVTVPDVGGIGKVGMPAENAPPPPAAPGAPQVDTPRGKPSGEGYADTVTGTAGKAAGPAAKGMKDWFNETFR